MTLQHNFSMVTNEAKRKAEFFRRKASFVCQQLDPELADWGQHTEYLFGIKQVKDKYRYEKTAGKHERGKTHRIAPLAFNKAAMDHVHIKSSMYNRGPLEVNDGYHLSQHYGAPSEISSVVSAVGLPLQEEDDDWRPKRDVTSDLRSYLPKTLQRFEH